MSPGSKDVSISLHSRQGGPRKNPTSLELGLLLLLGVQLTLAAALICSIAGPGQVMKDVACPRQ